MLICYRWCIDTCVLTVIKYVRGTRTSEITFYRCLWRCLKWNIPDDEKVQNRIKMINEWCFVDSKKRGDLPNLGKSVSLKYANRMFGSISLPGLRVSSAVARSMFCTTYLHESTFYRFFQAKCSFFLWNYKS